MAREPSPAPVSVSTRATESRPVAVTLPVRASAPASDWSVRAPPLRGEIAPDQVLAPLILRSDGVIREIEAIVTPPWSWTEEPASAVTPVVVPRAEEFWRFSAPATTVTAPESVLAAWSESVPRPSLARPAVPRAREPETLTSPAPPKVSARLVAVIGPDRVREPASLLMRAAEVIVIAPVSVFAPEILRRAPEAAPVPVPPKVSGSAEVKPPWVSSAAPVKTTVPPADVPSAVALRALITPA